MKKILLRIAQVLIGLYLLVCVLMYFFQEKMIFFPEKLADDHIYQFDQAFEEINIESADGVRLNGLLFPTDSSKGLIFYLHGNGGSIDSWGTAASTYTDLRYDVFMPDYRSYGKSEGKIKSQAQMFADMQAVYDHVLTRYKEEQIILLGYSLGTGFATKLASDNHPKMLILQAPFYSITDMVRNLYPFVPTALLKYKLRTNQHIKDCSMPVILFHGDADEMIPHEASARLKDLANDATLITLPGQGHHGMTQNPNYLDALENILRVL